MSKEASDNPVESITGETQPQQFTAVNNNSTSSAATSSASTSNTARRPSSPPTNGIVAPSSTSGPSSSQPSGSLMRGPVFGASRPDSPLRAAPSASAPRQQQQPIAFGTVNGSGSALSATGAVPTNHSLHEVHGTNGHLHHDHMQLDSPHTQLQNDDNWQGLPDSTNGREIKRKRSVSPTTQTQHHHLAAHEAAMGAVMVEHHTPHRPIEDMSPEDDGDRSVRGGTLEDGSPHPQVDHNGVRIDQKRRKRVFSNRTKTGCITCRRRKKKCDEGKPECTNCKRGGFLCEGYSGKVSWQKPPGKQLPQSVITGPPYIQSKEDQPGIGSPTPGHSHSLQLSTPTSAHRHSMDERPYLPRSGAAEDQSGQAPAHETLSPQNAQSYLALRGDPIQGTPSSQSQGPSASSSTINPIPEPVSFSHQALAAATGSLVRARSEKEKMINSELYHANSLELVAEREACKAACWRFNNIASNPNMGVSDAERGRLLLDILRPGNKWEMINTGSAPAGQGTVTYATDNGHMSDIVDVQVDAPFTCSYGYNIRLGKNVYIEFGCTILDSCSVTIKARTILSPGVSIYSATHPIDPRKRNGSRGPEMAKPVLIEEDCWLGGNVIVLGGITIGKGSVVGAGSVVTRDVPPFTVVAGNPARVIRGIYQTGVDM